MTAAASSRIQSVFDELGIEPDPQLVELALTHRSWAYEHDCAPHNERLEFLGDSVLGVIVTEHLYRTFPDQPEGQLAKVRAAVVSTTALAARARTLGLGSLIKLGRGEVLTGGDDKDSILADTMEAVIGAVFLSCGRDAASDYVHYLCDDVVAAASTRGVALEWKTSLQDLCAELELPGPSYTHVASGPDHNKRFEARANIDGVVYEGAMGRSKKEAEMGAAQLAYEALQLAYADRLNPGHA